MIGVKARTGGASRDADLRGFDCADGRWQTLLKGWHAVSVFSSSQQGIWASVENGHDCARLRHLHEPLDAGARLSKIIDAADHHYGVRPTCPRATNSLPPLNRYLDTRRHRTNSRPPHDRDCYVHTVQDGHGDDFISPTSWKWRIRPATVLVQFWLPQILLFPTAFTLQSLLAELLGSSVSAGLLPVVPEGIHGP
jgi:hypothetical protein